MIQDRPKQLRGEANVLEHCNGSHWGLEWAGKFRALADEIDALLAAVREAHAQHADDLCWMPADMNRIFAAAGLPPQDLRVGDKEAMLANCRRYVACLEAGGPWVSYAELEAENTRLKAELDEERLSNRAMN